MLGITDLPASTLVGVAALAQPGYLIEVEAVAVIDPLVALPPRKGGVQVGVASAARLVPSTLPGQKLPAFARPIKLRR